MATTATYKAYPAVGISIASSKSTAWLISAYTEIDYITHT